MRNWLFGLMLVSALCACDPKPSEGGGASSAAAPVTTGAAKAPSAQEATAMAMTAVRAWVDAQNKGQVDAYLGLYDEASFKGVLRTNSGTEKKLDFATWKEDRTKMLQGGVTVAADDPKAVSWADNPGLGEGVVEVRFTQRWKNPRYADHGPKILHFRVAGGAAKIIYEEMVKSDKGWDDREAAKPAADQCQGDQANSELPCSLADGRMGWCKGGACKDICPAGYSYNPTDTRCHQVRDCPGDGPKDPSGISKSAQCEQCLGAWCFDDNATVDLK